MTKYDLYNINLKFRLTPIIYSSTSFIVVGHQTFIYLSTSFIVGGYRTRIDDVSIYNDIEDI